MESAAVGIFFIVKRDGLRRDGVCCFRDQILHELAATPALADGAHLAGTEGHR